MSAVRVARAATGRDRVIKFAGCYHGHADGFLVEAGSGALTLGVPTSPGVAASTAALTLTAPFNDLDSVAALLEANTAQVAAVIVEPIVGNMGVVPPAPGFLEGLRTLCDAARRAAHLRRGDDRLPRPPRRRPGALRRAARPDLPRQDHRRRAAGRRLRRPQGSDVAGRAGRPDVPGRHAVRQPARGRRRPVVDLGPERHALSDARSPDEAARRRPARRGEGRRRAAAGEPRRLDDHAVLHGVSGHRLRVGDASRTPSASAASTARCWRRASTCRRRSTRRGSCRRRTPSATSIARSRRRAPPSPSSADAPRRRVAVQAVRDTMRTGVSRAVANPMRS